MGLSSIPISGNSMDGVGLILSGTDSVVTLYNGGLSDLAVVSTSGQLIATIAGAAPLGAVAVAPGAATITLVKISVDASSTGKVQAGDLFSRS